MGVSGSLFQIYHPVALSHFPGQRSLSVESLISEMFTTQCSSKCTARTIIVSYKEILITSPLGSETGSMLLFLNIQEENLMRGGSHWLSWFPAVSPHPRPELPKLCLHYPVLKVFYGSRICRKDGVGHVHCWTNSELHLALNIQRPFEHIFSYLQHCRWYYSYSPQKAERVEVLCNLRAGWLV